MKKILSIVLVCSAVFVTALILVQQPEQAYGATPPTTVPQGGTGWGGWVNGSIPIGNGTSATSLRFATSSGLTFSTSTNSLLVGTSTEYGGIGLDQIFTQGRVNTGGWNSVICDTAGATGLGGFADLSNALCAAWGFFEDSDGDWLVMLNPNGGMFTQIDINAVINNGSGLFLNTLPWLKTSANSSVMEAKVRFNPTLTTGGSYYVGLTNTNPSGTTFEAFPSGGCFFNASSTATVKADWYAVCKKPSGGSTFVDTGIASSTSITTTGNFIRFRIEMDAVSARFYIQNLSGIMTKVATITGNSIASTTALVPGVYMGSVSATARTMDISGLRFWWYDDL